MMGCTLRGMKILVKPGAIPRAEGAGKKAGWATFLPELNNRGESNPQKQKGRRTKDQGRVKPRVTKKKK